MEPTSLDLCREKRHIPPGRAAMCVVGGRDTARPSSTEELAGWPAAGFVDSGLS